MNIFDQRYKPPYGIDGKVSQQTICKQGQILLSKLVNTIFFTIENLNCVNIQILPLFYSITIIISHRSKDKACK